MRKCKERWWLRIKSIGGRSQRKQVFRGLFVWTKKQCKVCKQICQVECWAGLGTSLVSPSLSDQSSPSVLHRFPCSKLLGLSLDTVVEAWTPSQLNIPTPARGARNPMMNIQQLLPSRSSLLSKLSDVPAPSLGESVPGPHP